MGEGGRFVHLVSRAAFGALERASGRALGSERYLILKNKRRLLFRRIRRVKTFVLEEG